MKHVVATEKACKSLDVSLLLDQHLLPIFLFIGLLFSSNCPSYFNSFFNSFLPTAYPLFTRRNSHASPMGAI